MEPVKKYLVMVLKRHFLILEGLAKSRTDSLPLLVFNINCSIFFSQLLINSLLNHEIFRLTYVEITLN